MQVVLVYLQPFRRSSLLKCVSQPEIAKNLSKTLIWKGGIQGRSRLSMLINLKSPSLMLVMIRSNSVPSCNRFYTIRAYIGKITSFCGGTLLWRPRSKGTHSPRDMKFCH